MAVLDGKVNNGSHLLFSRTREVICNINYYTNPNLADYKGIQNRNCLEMAALGSLKNRQFNEETFSFVRAEQNFGEPILGLTGSAGSVQLRQLVLT